MIEHMDWPTLGDIHLDVSYSANSASQVAALEEERERLAEKQAEEIRRDRLRNDKAACAMEQPAVNTAETNQYLQETIKYQKKAIGSLEEQLNYLKQLNDVNERQLQVLRNIFASGEDGVAVEKELIKIIRSQIDETHPLWEYVKDKGGDLLVNGVSAGLPILYLSLRTYLASKGIMLP